MGAAVVVVSIGALTLSLQDLWRYPQLPFGHDIRSHVVNTVEFARCQDDGVVWPSWLPDVCGGFGCPGPIFYNPLLYVFTGALVRTGLGVVTALKLAASVAMVASFAGMFVWAAQDAGPLEGALAAVLYLLAPYHLGDLYTRAAYPELVALALAPWLFYLARRVLRDPDRGPARTFVVALALLPLAHNVSTVLLGGLLAGDVVFHALASGGKRRVVRVLALLGLALALGAFFWIPALTEQPFTRLVRDRTITDQWQHNFKDVAWTLGGAGRAKPGRFDPYLGRLHVALLGLSLLAVPLARSRARREAWPLLGFQALVLGHLWLATESSFPVWAVLPIRVVQFPWRFLAPVTLGMAYLAARTLGMLAPWPRLHAGAVLALCVLALGQGRDLASRGKGRVEVPTAGALRRLQESGDSDWHFVPAGAGAPMTPGLGAFRIVSGGGTLVVDASAAQEHRLTVDGQGPIVLGMRIYDFPGWRVTLEPEGVELPIEREAGYGGMQVRIPSGRHQVLVHFAWIPLRKAALAVSVGALLLLAGLGGPGPDRTSSLLGRVAWRTGLAVLLGGVAVVAAELAARACPSLPGYPRARAQMALIQHRPLEALGYAQMELAAAAALPARAAPAWAEAVVDRYAHGGILATYVGGPASIAAPRRRVEPEMAFDSWLGDEFPPAEGGGFAAFTAALDVPRPGNYRFALDSDDGARLYIDARLVVDNWGEHALTRQEARWPLEAGRHELAVLYFNGEGRAALRLWWAGPGEELSIVDARVARPLELPWADKLLNAALPGGAARPGGSLAPAH